MSWLAGDKDFRDFFPELFFGEVAVEDAILTDRDGTGFLTDDHGDGVGALGQADGGAVPQSGRAVLHFLFRDWKNAGRTSNAVVGDDHAAIMQWGLGVEDGHRQLGRKLCVQHHTAVEVLLQADSSLDGEKCADSFFGQIDDGVGKALKERQTALAGK